MAHITPVRGLSRTVAFSLCAALAYSQSALGFHALASSVQKAWPRHVPAFSHAPIRPYLGQNPGRDPVGRGCVWTAAQIARARESADDVPRSGWQASTVLDPAPQQHTLAVAPEPGGSYGWEGSYSGTNTANGNKLTKLHLFDFKVKGGMTLDFTLYHNSQTNYNDELGHGWTWTYDIYVNDLSTNPVVHWGDGRSVPYTASGGVYTPPAGITDQLQKLQDNSWRVTKKDGTVYNFNVYGFCRKVVDRNGNAITLTLNAGNYITKITDPAGRIVDITLDTNGNFTGVEAPDGRVWTFTRDSSDDLTSVTWPTLDGTSYSDQYTYNSGHDILTHTDKRGKVWSSSYNSDGSLASETNPLNKTTSYTYGGSYTEIADPRGKKERHNYSSGMLSSVVDRSNYSENYLSRDSNKNVTSLQDRRGKTWEYTYDSKNNVLTAKNPLPKTWTYTYNSFSQVLTAKNHLNEQTDYSYDTKGNLLTVTNPLSKVVATNTYDTAGLLQTVTNALSKVTTVGYDTNGLPNSVTDPLSQTTGIVYDSMSRVTSVTDPLSHVEQASYDAWGRLVTLTHADSSTETRSFDPEGNLTQEKDELNHATNYVYDDAGRLTSRTNAESETESYGYDDADRRTTVTNGRGKTRTYTYTDRGDVSTLTMPDSAVEQWTPNGNGDVEGYTNPLGQTISYAYDNASRQTGVDYPTGTDTSFGYDDANRRTSMVDATGTTTWGYDAASRLTSFGSPQGSQTYGYDDAGRRTSMTETGLGTTSYSYDDAGRQTGITNRFSEATTLEYDAANRLVKKTFSAGTYDTYAYDSRSRMTSVTRKKPDGTGWSSDESYVYDDAGNLTSRTNNGVTTSFTYDDIDQLLTEARTGYSASYTYDANGNRLTKTLGGVTETYAYDDGDKLNTVMSGGSTVKSFTYDTAGRTTSVTTSSGTTTLSYDYEDRVTGITYPNLTTNSFTYNGLDARVGKTDSGGTSAYRRDGASVLAPVLSDAGASYTPGISERRGSQTRFFHPDRLGTYSQLTSPALGSVAKRQYDAFGNLTSITGSTSTPFGFAGGWGYQEDGDSGLKLLGHRYYDSSTGRFLTRDPAKNGPNWYGYCRNNPLKWVDPTGLKEIIIIVGDTQGGEGKKDDLDRAIQPIIDDYEDEYGDSYDITPVLGADQEMIEAIISNASAEDIIVIVAHGDSGYIELADGNLIDEDMVGRIADKRRKRKRGKMKQIDLIACGSADNPAMNDAWGRLSDNVFGVEGKIDVRGFGWGAPWARPKPIRRGPR